MRYIENALNYLYSTTITNNSNICLKLSILRLNFILRSFHTISTFLKWGTKLFKYSLFEVEVTDLNYIEDLCCKRTALL